MTEQPVMAPVCEHQWSWVSPAGASNSAKICQLCHAPDAAWLNELADIEVALDAARAANETCDEKRLEYMARITAALALKDALEEIVFCDLYLDRVGRELIDTFWPMLQAALTGDQK